MRAVFLDRDGVINKYRKNYVRVPEDFVYYDFTPEAMQILAGTGLALAVITNQSGVAREYTTREIVEGIHEMFSSDAWNWGAPVTAIAYCPHRPEDRCRCRKPNTWLFEQVARDHDLDLEGSYLIGDSPSDMEAGARLGLTTVRVATGRGAEPVPLDWVNCNVPDLLAAAREITELEGKEA